MEDYTGRTANSPVVQAIPVSGAVLTVNSESLVWFVSQSASAVEEASVLVLNAGSSALNWTALASHDWIVLNGSGQSVSGSAPSELKVAVLPGQLPAGRESSGTITISSPGAHGSPKTIAVRVNKTAAPIIAIDPQLLSWEVTEGSTQLVKKSLIGRNIGQEPLEWSLTIPSAATWLSVNPANGSVPAGGQQTVEVCFNTSRVAVGAYYAQLTVSSNAANGSSQPVDCYIQVLPRAPGLYDFPTDEEGWNWFSRSPELAAPDHGWSSGSLYLTKQPLSGSPRPVVFGSYESPKNPAVAMRADSGRLLRARFHLRSESPTPAKCPGFRLRAMAAHMVQSQGNWIPNFQSQDYNSLATVYYSTLDRFHIAGREPGSSGKVYTILYIPEQTSSLSASDVAVYFACDLLDTDVYTNDSGTLYIDQVEIDSISLPAVGTGQAESVFGATDFSAWTTAMQPIGPQYNEFGLGVTADSAGVAVTVTRGNQWFEAGASGPTGALVPGRYYRAVFDVSSTEQAGGDFGPTVRASMISRQFVYSADKELQGGSLLARFTSTPRPFEIWFQAPSELPTTPGQTEPMKLRFESWLTNSSTGWPFYKNVSGTVHCTGTFVESFPGE
jgi:hypothetical protein